MDKFLEIDDSTSTRVILKFLSVILYLLLHSTMKTSYRLKALLWGPNAHARVPTSSWEVLKKYLIYPLITNKDLCYYRFVDDICMIWIGSEQELNDFFAKLNSRHTTIKFEFKYSNTQINSIDTMVCIKKSNTLTIR